ncbi:MAG: hypothetical protein COY66_01905 [Candidatus Kerfeldbacteria bacterium CG_4_10_14_0_8_um_filter_42_10]|uniref:Uncharacterized protein n=1 Tax=Candidatus Kerfeldbacteria bacterium CG_4_10_14_0_8_um_filter_42_10 TaxID=2014248 RepID=A0A2M7RKD7_9BACT|nr:MAG: hypothetical protein COY66_01905 [Candidatus Kerfeldbacteria bacterium CG_4_10_14_0_8_um_filter_42_10]
MIKKLIKSMVIYTNIKIKHLRKSFFEIVDLLINVGIEFWVARGLTEQILKGVIDDDEKNHDIDFHILASDKKKLKAILVDNNYQIKKERFYKIQILAKTDNRRIEFVFLEDYNGNYIHQSKGIKYTHPKELFGEHTCNIKGLIVKIPWPLKQYLMYRN